MRRVHVFAKIENPEVGLYTLQYHVGLCIAGPLKNYQKQQRISISAPTGTSEPHGAGKTLP